MLLAFSIAPATPDPTGSYAEAVAAAHSGASRDDWPCAGAHGTSETVWFLDDAAAGKLSV